MTHDHESAGAPGTQPGGLTAPDDSAPSDGASNDSAANKSAGTDMGSTLVMAVLDGDQDYIGHVGDSRSYLIHAEGIRRLTAAHSLAEPLVAIGQNPPQQARSDERDDRTDLLS